MENEIKYSVTLHDNFSEKLHHIDEGVKKVGESLEKINKAGEELLTTIGLSIAAFKGFEFIKEGVEEYKNIRIQTALFNNELKNSGTYSKELVENLKEMREHLSEIGFFKEVEQLQFQRNLMKNFPYAGTGFLDMTAQASADLATTEGISLSEAGNRINNIIRPKRGGGFRVDLGGIEEILGNAKYREHEGEITKLASIDPNIAYPKIISMIEKYRLKGAAETAVKNNPEYELNKSLEEFSVTLGQITEDIKVKFLPEMKKIVDWFHNLSEDNLKTIERTLTTIVKGLVAISVLLIGVKVIEGIKYLVTLASSLPEIISSLLFGKEKETAASEGASIQLNFLAGAAERAAIALNLIGGESGLASVAGASAGAAGISAGEGAASGGLIASMTSNPAGWIVLAATAAGIAINYWATNQAKLGQVIEENNAKRLGPLSDNTNNPDANMVKRLAERDPFYKEDVPEKIQTIADIVKQNSEITIAAMKKEQSKNPHLKKDNSPHLPGKSSLDTVHGPKNTNVYITINGGFGNFKIENTSNGSNDFLTKDNRDAVRNDIIELLEEAVNDGLKIRQ